MSNRYKEDILDIVGISPDLAAGLPLPASKEPIAATRGIGYQNGKTGGVASKSGSPGETLVDVAEDGASTEGVYGGSGSQASPQNTFQQAQAIGENIFDLADVLSGLDGPTPTDTLTTSYNTPTEAGSLTGLTGMTDCDSGSAIDIRFDDKFAPRDAGETSDRNWSPIWPDPDTPPTAPGYTNGYRWASAGQYASTPGALVEYGLAQKDAADPPDAPHVFVEWTQQDEAQWTYSVNDKNGIPVGSVTILRSSCTVGVDAGCDATAPTVSEWPADDTISFKTVNGQFVTSEYDSDRTAPYINPTSKLDVCFGSSQYATIELLGGGDYAVYETSTSGGSPSGVVRIYRKDGTMKTATDATGLAGYRSG